MKYIPCEHCTKEISFDMARVTMNRFRKALCPQGQIEVVKKTYPEKLKGFAIANIKKSAHLT